MARHFSSSASTPAFIELVASSSQARATYEPLVQACAGRTRDAFLFGILTATERTDAAERALSDLKYEVENPNFETVQLTLRRAGIVYYNSKARYVVAFLERYNQDPSSFEPQPGESCSQYRDRMLARGVLGLSFVKMSFACYLAFGGGDVICPDRHIVRVFTGKPVEDWMFKKSRKAISFLRDIERHFVNVASSYGWSSASALQWAVWCEAIQQVYSHDVVSSLS